MQRYRVNYKLLIGLVIGAFVSAGSAFGLWRWQVDTNAEKLIGRADYYINEQEPREALLALYQYLSLRPDDAKAQIRNGHFSAEIARDTFDRNWEWNDVRISMEALNQAITKTEIWKQELESASPGDKADLLDEISPREGDDAKITEDELRSENLAMREELAEILLMFGDSHKALPHFERVIDEIGETDPERIADLEAKQIQCLRTVDRSRCITHCRELVGFVDEGFDEEAATNPHVPQAYSTLAWELHDGGTNDRANALRVIERMVEINPEMPDAHIMQHLYMRSIAEQKEQEAAREDAVAQNETESGPKQRAEKRAADARSEAESADATALAALQRAYELDPANESTLLLKGQRSFRDFAKAYEEADELLGSRADGILRKVSKLTTTEQVRELLVDERLSETKIEPVVGMWGRANESLDQAIAYFAEGMEKFPQNQRFYDLSANAVYRKGDLDEALRVVNEGIKRFSLTGVWARAGLRLSNTKVDILLAKEDVPAIEKEIRDLRDTKDSRFMAAADLHRARIHMVNEEWTDAEKLLQGTFEKLMTYQEDSVFRELAVNAGEMLGLSQERLGRDDEAFKSYQTVVSEVQSNPRTISRLVAVARRLQRVGDVPELADVAPGDAYIEDQRQRPDSERDWDSVVQNIDRQLSRGEITEGFALFKKAQVRYQQARSTTDKAEQEKAYDKALSLANQIIEAEGDPRQNLWMAISMIALEPDTGAHRAHEMLVKAVDEGTLPDNVKTRDLRAKLVGAKGGEDVSARLMDLTEGLDDWHPVEASSVLSTVAWQLNGLRMGDQAWQVMRQASEIASRQLPIQKSLFELAYAQKNDARMQQAQEAILSIVGDESDPDYVITEANRKLMAVHNGELDLDELAAMTPKLEAALERRPDWAELQQVVVRISAVTGNTSRAMGMLGGMRTTDPNVLAIHVKLLATERRFEEAYQQLQLMSAVARTAMLEQLHAEILQEVGDVEGAYRAAQEYSEMRSADPSVQLWFAKIARAAGRLDEAETTLNQISEIAPSDLQIWEQLIMLHLQQRDGEKVAATLRRAQLGIDEDRLPDWMAKSYELFQRWPQAEKILLSIYGHRLDEPFANRQLGQFYLARATGGRYGPLDAAPYINRILKDVYAGRLDPNHQHASWARRQAAQLLFARGDYPSSVKAERMLTRYSGDQGGTPEENELLTAILSARIDPESHLKLIKALTQAKAQSGLGPGRTILLGRMLSRMGQWEDAQEHLDDALARYPENLGLLAGYASLLIDNKEFRDAERMIRRVSALPGGSTRETDLRIALANAQGDKKEVRQLLARMWTNLKNSNPDFIQHAPSIVRLAEQSGDYQFAIGLMRLYASQEPSAKPELARLMAFYDDPKTGLDELRVLFDDDAYDPEQILLTAVQAYRMRRAEASEDLDVVINGLIRTALRRDGASARRLVSQAEIFEVQERYDKAIAEYSSLLKRNDVPDLIRATAANNLAYVMAFTETDPDALSEAVDAANEAVSLMGPISEVLDTRASVYLALKDYEQALNDMEMAIRVDPTAGKYFHLAKAKLGLNDAEGALEAWRQAEALGTGPENIAAIEQDELYRFKQKIDALAEPGAAL